MLRNPGVRNTSILKKIFAAFVLAGIAISVALLIARFSFRELLGTVNELSHPNEKLTILNKVFEEVTTLDQLQRAEAIKNPDKPYQSFLEQSASVDTWIDSLRQLSWDKGQQRRLNQMKGILEKRNELFFSYLKVKARLLNNQDFAHQVDTLSAILQNNSFAIDSGIIRTLTKTTTTYFPDTTPAPKKQPKPLLKRIFSKKKNNQIAKLDTPTIKVYEEQSVTLDTLAVARQNDALLAVEKMMRDMEREQRIQRKNLQQQELDLIHANSLFINQLLSTLREVEKEELQHLRATNNHAVSVISQSISRFNLLIIAFLLTAALMTYFIALDISKSNYYKRQLESERDRAEELSQVKQRFLANMSHELRTPLQSIIGFAEQLKQKAKIKDDAVDAIHSSSEHLLHIVNEVLDYSRISSGSVTLSVEKFRLLALTREVEAAMRIQAERKNLAFILDIEKASEFILAGDPFRLRQILYNVIGNAIKFTHRGYVKLSLKTYDEGKDVLSVFEISDTGIGIESENLGNIFNQFEQANEGISRQFGGTGLGLTIVKTLVDAHEGLIEVKSEPDVGSTFRIELRFNKAPAHSLQAAPAVQDKIKSPKVGKVMVVDDDALILRLCSIILKKHQVQHDVYNEGKLLLHHSPDPLVTHIFLDIRMPDMNGIELCRELRKIYPSSTKLIALTAHVLSEEKSVILRQGFDAILTKPFHENELIDALGVHPSTETPADQADLSLLRKMTLGDEMLFQSIVSQFVEETLGDLECLNDAIEDKDASECREVVHKLSGRFSQLGVVALADDLRRIEDQFVAGKSVEDVTNELRPLVRRVHDAVIQIRLTTMEQLN